MGELKKSKSYKRDFGVPKDSDQTSSTDPQSRIMKHSNCGFGHSYNARPAVYVAHQINVAAELTDCESDSGQLPEILEAMARTWGTA